MGKSYKSNIFKRNLLFHLVDFALFMGLFLSLVHISLENNKLRHEISNLSAKYKDCK